MNIYNYIPISISVISIILSLSVAYLAYFKPAKIKLLVGSNLIVFNSFINTISGKVWGGITFVLPVTFYNWSPRGGSIYQVRLAIGRPENPQQYFDLAWSNFVKFVDGVNWQDEDVAQPIAMSAKSSVNKFIRFDWNPLTSEKFKITTGQYELFLFVWTEQSEKPSIQEMFYFTITDDICEIFQKTIENNESFGIWIPIDNSRRSNKVTTRIGLIREYQK